MNLKGLLALLFLLFIAFLFSCTKINEATELGGDLIPAVDNVNTFDTLLDVNTAYYPYDDSSKHLIAENMALGKLIDPVFGTTTADMYFNLSSLVYNASPFTNKDSVGRIDSVVLSLSLQSGYGDTTATGLISCSVSEIATGNNFSDTTLYRFDDPGFSTTGSALGNKTFSVRELKDSVPAKSKYNDTTTKVANVLRIRLNNSLGDKLRNFGFAAGEPYIDDTTFRKAFRGLAVKATGGTSTLAYFNLYDQTSTRLLVYYHFKTTNSDTSLQTASFVHSTYSQANSIKRTASGAYLTNLGSPSSQTLYIQSSPSGSYVGMKIPGLDAFPNKVIHRAELIANKVPSGASDAIFGVPNRLFLDHKGTNNSKDSAYMFDNDLIAGVDGTLNFASFGGTLKSDNTYRFNITRYVQGIVTRKERNDSLRLFAPLRSNVYSKAAGEITITTLDNIAAGRVVLASGNNADKSIRLRLRIIYSNL